jgi:DNA-binding Xre family transcriptional regulator
MITSDKQYKASKEQLLMLSESMTSTKKEGVPDIIEAASKAQIQELMNEIQFSIEEYEKLKSSKPSDIEIHSLDDLMVVPIRYRISAHMSIDAFSRKVGISARQIARYETESYQNTNSSTLRKILGVLEINLNGKVA